MELQKREEAEKKVQILEENLQTKTREVCDCFLHKIMLCSYSPASFLKKRALKLTFVGILSYVSDINECVNRYTFFYPSLLSCPLSWFNERKSNKCADKADHVKSESEDQKQNHMLWFRNKTEVKFLGCRFLADRQKQTLQLSLHFL